MTRINRVTTGLGDQGETRLADGRRVPKYDPRIEAIGAVEEANACIGAALAVMGQESTLETAADVRHRLQAIQNELFDVGADLARPVEANEARGERLRITASYVERLEAAISRWNQRLRPLESFILPGGSQAAAQLHVARTVVRRAERHVARLLATEPSATNPLILVYLNRLGDLLFVAARLANRDGQEDVTWVPGSGSGPPH